MPSFDPMPRPRHPITHAPATDGWLLSFGADVPQTAPPMPPTTPATNWLGASADWSVAADWSNGEPDGSTATAMIAATGPYVVHVAAGDTLTTASTTLNAAGATLAIAGTLTPGILSVAAGTLLLQGGVIGTGSLVTQSMVSIADQGGNWAAVLAGSGVAWSNNGTVTDAGYISYNNALSTIANTASGVFDLTTNDATLQSNYNGTCTLANAGLLEKTGGAGTSLINAPLTNTGTVSVSIGTLELGAGGALGGVFTTAGSGAILLGGGTFSTVAATATLGGAIVVSNAVLQPASGDTLTLSGTDSLGVVGGSAAQISGPGTVATTGATTVGNNGGNWELVLAGGTWRNTGSVTDAGYISFNNVLSVINNAAGATFALTTANATLQSNYSGTLSLVNAGYLGKTAGGGLSLVAGTVANSGTLSASSGTLQFSGAVASSGTISATGGLLELSGGGALGGVFATSGTGTIALAAGSFTTLSSSTTLAGTLSILGNASLAPAAGDTLTLTGTDNFFDTNGSASLITGAGTVVTAGATSVQDAGGNWVTGLAGGGTWRNTGTFADAGTIVFYNGTDFITNTAGAVFDLTTDDARLYYYSGTGTLANAGYFGKTGGANRSYVDCVVTSTGTLGATSGTLQFDNSVTISGTVTAANGAVNFNAGAVLGGTFFTSGTGMIYLGGGLFTAAGGTATLGGALTVLGYATLNTVAGGTIVLSGNDSFVDNGQTCLLEGGGTIVTSGTALVADAGGNWGVALGGGVTWQNTGTLSDAGTITLYQQTATIDNAASGAFLLTANDAAIYQSGGTGTLDNAGYFARTGGTGTSVIDAVLNNTGTVAATSGTLDFIDGGSLGGAFTTSGGGLIEFGGGTFTLAGSSETISGQIDAQGDVFLSPGSNATLTLQGAATFGASGYAVLGGSGGIVTEGTTTIADAGQYNWSTVLLSKVTWLNTGTVNDGGIISFNNDLSTLDNSATGTINLTSADATMVYNDSGSGTLINQGLLAKTGGSNTTTLQLRITNSGTIAGDAGTLQLDALTNLAGGTLTGASVVAAGGGEILFESATQLTTLAATLVLNGATAAMALYNTATEVQASLQSQLASIALGGDLILENGQTYAATANAGTLADAGLIDLAAGTLIATALTVAAGGTLQGAGVVDGPIGDAGLIQASSGTLVLGAVSGTGTLAAAAKATIDLTAGGALTQTVSGAGTLLLDGSAGFTLASPADTIAQTIIDAGASLTGGGTLGGKLTVLGNLAVAGAALTTTGLTIAAGGSVTGFGTLAGPVTDSGLLDATAGTLSVSGLSGIKAGSWTGLGGLQADAGATLRLADNTRITTDAGLITLSGTGATIEALNTTSAAEVALDATLADIAAGGTLALANGRVFLATAAAGTLTVDGVLSLSGGGVSAKSVALDTGAMVSGSGTVTAKLDAVGTATLAGGTLTLGGALTGSGALNIAAGETLVLAGSGAFGGTLQIAGDVALQGASVGAAALIVAAGGTLSGAGTITSGITNGGVVDAAGGRLAVAAITGLAGGTLSAGGLQAEAGATLQLAADTGLTTIAGGAITLSGAGATLRWLNSATQQQVGLGASLLSIGAAGTLTLLAASTFTGTANGGVLQDAGLLVLDGGTLSVGTLMLTGAGVFDDLAGTFKGDIAGQSTVTIASGAVFAPAGGSALGGVYAGPGTLLLSAAQSYTLLPGAQITAGLLDISAGTALSGSGTIGGEIGNAGTILASGGTLVLDGALDDGGTLSVAAGAVLSLQDGGSYFGTVLGAGTVQNSDLVSGAVNGANLAGATLSLNNSAAGEFFGATGDGAVLNGGAGGTVTVVNQGAIGGGQTGLAVSGALATVTNDGFIAGTYGAGLLASGPGPVAIVNAGLIVNYDSAGIAAVSLNGAASATLTNSGTIIGGYYAPAGGAAVQFGPGNDRLIVLPGAVFVGGVSGGGGKNTLELAAGAAAGTLAGLGSQFTGFASLQLDAAADWVLAGANALQAGATTSLGNKSTLSVAGTLSMAAGDALKGAGTLVIAAGGAILASATTKTADTISAGSLTNQGWLDVTGGKTLSLSGATLTNLHTGTLTAGVFEADGGSTLQLTTNAAITTDSADIVLAGTGSVLDWAGTGGTTTLQKTLAAIGQAGTLALAGGAVFTAAASLADQGLVALQGGSLTTPGLSITATGTLSGAGSVAGTVANQGMIEAAGGILSLAGAVSGGGAVAIAGNAELLAGAALGAASLNFLASGGTLALAQPGGFSGTIAGFGTTDTIDLLGSVVTGDNFASNMLTLTGAAGTIATLDFTGNYTGFQFAFFSDGHGGTTLLLT